MDLTIRLQGLDLPELAKSHLPGYDVRRDMAVEVRIYLSIYLSCAMLEPINRPTFMVLNRGLAYSHLSLNGPCHFLPFYQPSQSHQLRSRDVPFQS